MWPQAIARSCTSARQAKDRRTLDATYCAPQFHPGERPPAGGDGDAQAGVRGFGSLSSAKSEGTSAWECAGACNLRGRPWRRRRPYTLLGMPVRRDGHDNPDGERDNAADPCSLRQGVRPPLLTELALGNKPKGYCGR